MAAIVGILFVAFIFVLALFYNALSWGFVVSKFYLWFILSIYPQAPQISLLHFVGIAFFLGAIMPKYYSTKVKDEYEDKKNQWIGNVLNPWLTLICGYLIYLCY